MTAQIRGVQMGRSGVMQDLESNECEAKLYQLGLCKCLFLTSHSKYCFSFSNSSIGFNVHQFQLLIILPGIRTFYFVLTL